MLLFGTPQNPFSTEIIDDKYYYVRGFLSKSINEHLIETLNYLSGYSYTEWKISEIEIIDAKVKVKEKVIRENKINIYKNYKIHLKDSRNVTKEAIDKLWSLKTLLNLTGYNESEDKDLNFGLLEILANDIMTDLTIDDEELVVSDLLCDYLSINRSEFLSILHNNSQIIINDFLTTKSYAEISNELISKISNYYEFLNKKDAKYDIDIPISFLNGYNSYLFKQGKQLIGFKLNIGYPTLINYPVFGGYDGKYSKMKKVSGSNTFEPNPARIYNYAIGLVIAHKYTYTNTFNGMTSIILFDDIKESGMMSFFNTGDKYFSIKKRGERNPYAIFDLTDDVYFEIIQSLINHGFGNTTLVDQVQQNMNNEKKQKEKLNERVEELEPVAENGGIKQMDNVKSEDFLSELQKLIGLSEVKKQIETLVNYIKVQKLRSTKDLKTTQVSLHTIFSGSPGTGKTTVARLYAGILKQLGVLKKGHLIEADRSALVAGYLGQTAIKTNSIIDKALDGVLFIDEAYSLTNTNGDTYGEEAVDILVKRMEDDREKLVIILAGYKEEMEKFIESNPGLKSRFNRYIDFENYTSDELLEIFMLQAKEQEYVLSDSAIHKIKGIFDEIVKSGDKNYGNGRFVRNLFERVIENHSNRIVGLKLPVEEDLVTITEEDINI